MAHSRILLNDGTSAVLLNDGTSYVLLNAEGEAHAGLALSGTHPTIAYYSGVEQLHPLDFTFMVEATTTRKLKLEVKLRASFIEWIKSIPSTVKSTILVESKYPFKLKSSLLTQLRETVELRAVHIKHYNLVLNTRKVKEEKIISRREMEKAKLKKALLKLVEEFMEDGN